MANIYESAYPKFKDNISQKELNEVYAPTIKEINYAKQVSRGKTVLCFLILLKTFQRLGYFVSIEKVPVIIIDFISNITKNTTSSNTLSNYNNSGTRLRHTQAIREYLNVKKYDSKARHLIVEVIATAAKTKDEPLDLVNLAIEELIRNYYELPTFNTLEKAAKRIRLSINRSFYKTIVSSLNEDLKQKIDSLIENEEESRYTKWNTLKEDPSSPTVNHLKELVSHLKWLKELNILTKNLENIPYVKIKQFALEAKSLDASKMKQLEPFKRYALILSLIYIQTSNTIDDLAEMLIKRMMLIHRKGKDALEKYRKDHVQITDKLVTTLKYLVMAYQKEGTIEDKFSAINSVLSSKNEEVLENCEAHLSYAGNNYYSFLWTYFKSHRTVLLDIIKNIKICSTNQDLSLEETINFLRTNENKRADWIETIRTENKGNKDEKKIQLLNLSWIPDVWWKLVTEKSNRGTYPEKVNRRHFEVCLFTQIMWDLKSGDLYIEGGDKYSDFREQLISWEDYNKNKDLFGKQVNLPVESADFVKQLKGMMQKTITDTDKSFPDNQHVKIVNHEPVLTKLEKIKYPEQKKKIDKLIEERLKPINILDVISDTNYWLNWTKYFGLISGHESKLKNPNERYLLSTFCYGCNIGPTQLAQSFEEVTRKHISWISQHHITEEKIENATFHIINGYHVLPLPKLWGTGNIAATDGTQKDLYRHNLFAEGHIRYGGYGGLAYNLVSDTYMILFTHFIPCGTWEGTYLVDLLMSNKSDIQPNTIHGDTQSQNAPVFGLAYLLGINLMPRIRNWKDLTLYRPDENKKYKHIDKLFTDVIDWALIETYFPDMLRVAMSIKEGKIKPSTILKKLGTYSRKNKLYQAFRELGRVIRTDYLMKYMGDIELRSTIQSATNKSEGYNGFSKWISFGNNGVIRENTRDDQRKIIKYNQLVASCLIFYNACMLTHVIEDLKAEGHVIDDATLASLSPFITHHINRFGKYKFDPSRKPIAIKYDFMKRE